jgi:acyl transferase domain-containing protein/phosphopantetheinyl transferase
MSRGEIAIVGMACAFPGANDLTQFWYNLVNGIDALAISSSQPSDTAPSPHIPRSQKVNDTENVLLREVIEVALMDAGMPPGNELRSRTRLIVGQGHCGDGTPRQGVDEGLAKELSKELGLEGDALQVYAAEVCSLRALALGVEDLREGRCDVVVLAAVHLLDHNRTTEHSSETSTGNVGQSKKDTHRLTESLAAVVLKRRTDAETAGDSTYASIKGVATTQDGELEQAYADAAITPEDISLLECQGVSFTADNADGLGVITGLFGHRDKHRALRPMGALTPQISQTGAAAGLASFIKTTLCLSNKLIPPTEGAETSPEMLDQLPFYLNVEPRPWIHHPTLPPRTAALITRCPTGGGSHVIMEEIPNTGQTIGVVPRPIRAELLWDSELVVLSGKDTKELARQAGRLLAFLQRDGLTVNMADIAYAQSLQFDHQASCRLAIVCGNIEELRQHLQLCHSRLQTGGPNFEDVEAIYFSTNGDRPFGKIACVFPGQGFPGLLGPYADHLLDLCLRFPEVREAFDLADKRDGHPEDVAPTNQVFFPPATFSEEERRRLRQRMASPRLTDVERIQIPSQRDLSSYCVLIANWGSWKLLQKLGVSVDMMFGQSHGELSALCSAGGIDFDKVLPIHWEVDFDPEEHISKGGRMALACTSEEHLAPLLEHYDSVNIAVHIAPSFQIIGGEASQLEAFVAELRKSGNWTQFLPYPAIHTPRLTSLRPVMEPALERLPVHPFRVPVYSGMTCDIYPDNPDAVRKTIIANLDHPVLLWQTTRKMYRDGARIFIQVGGGATMYAQAKTNIGADDVVAVSLDVDYRGAIPQLNHLCAALLTNGVTLDLAYLYEHRSVTPLNIDVTETELAGFERVSVESGKPSPEGTASPDEPRMPFIGSVLHYVENQEIIIERVLELREDLFLAHHLFVPAEGIKPISARLPVMPLTVSMELMAEVAACLAPGCGLLGFEDIKATRWIELVDTDTLRLKTSAKLYHYDEATDTYRIAVATHIEEQNVPAVQATLLFGRRYQVNLDLHFPEPENPRPYPLSAKQIYEKRVLFHGPTFQSISGDTVLADRAVIGELAVLPKNGMFSSTRRPELLTDPILLDAVGQLIGLWAIDNGVYVFPIAIRQAEFYCPTPAVGTRVPVHVEVTQYSSKLLYADVEIQDGAGRVWTRIKGWGDWVFRWSKKVYDFRRQPTRHCVSHDFVPTSLLDEAVAQTITKFDLRNIELHSVGRFYLHMEEMPTFSKLGKIPARQLQWLLGRIAAKDAVRQWLARQTGTEMLHPAAFAIENDEKGQPVVKKIPEGLAPPKLSIAHSEDRAVAIVHRNAVGIDIERIADRDERFLETFATRQERERLADFVGSEDRNAWITRLWCAKEATGKMIGTGVEPSPQQFEATDVNGNGAISILHHPTGSTVSVKTTQESDFIIAHTEGPLSPSEANPEMG